MDNAWIVTILGGLIASGLYSIISRLIAGKNSTESSRLVLLSSIFIACVVFIFGSILQAAAQQVIEGGHVSWGLMMYMREQHPGLLLMGLLISGMFPGFVTGMICVKARSLIQRIWFASIAAVISLSVFDLVWFLWGQSLILESQVMELQPMADISYLYFSLISNLLGGSVGGVIIGVLTHGVVNVISKENEEPRA